MCSVPVLYATSEGQTRRISERLAQILREQGLSSTAIEVSSAEARAVDWPHVRGAVVAASLHAGRHQRAACKVARVHAAELSAIPSVFVSVSLSAASKNEHERDAARKLADGFTTTAGWRPWQVACVAGRLAYTQYGFLIRWFMQRIAKKEGGPTDTSRDHELTDWSAVERLARDLADRVRLETTRVSTLSKVG
jgi:menaquinone-dependent protoporphyrinogen oxidase